MATTKPRLMLTLEPQTYATFKQYAELDGRPLATVISSLLNDTRPHFEKLGVLLQQAEAMVHATHAEKHQFMAHLDVGLARAKASQDLIYSDLVTTVKAPSAKQRPASAGVRAVGAKKGPDSLIHRNKSPKSMPKRVPAGSALKKAKK